ncbi:MAG: DUF1648 domain-containing protein [Terracidiphilus sp.]|jgi:uncharacterized membrane protein
MRKWLEAICLAGMAFIFWITYQALNGPQPLPSRIPTHFDAAGNANGWGPPSTLYFLPLAAVALYLLFTVISLIPTGIRSTARLTVESRARIEAMTHQMMAWVKVEVVALLACMQWFILSAVRQGSGSIPTTLVPIFLVAVFANVAWHTVAIFRALRTGSSS